MKKKLFVFIYIFVVTINVFSQLDYRFQGGRGTSEVGILECGATNLNKNPSN